MLPGEEQWGASLFDYSKYEALASGCAAPLQNGYLRVDSQLAHSFDVSGPAFLAIQPSMVD